MEALRVESLSKSFGALTVVFDVSFTVAAEERRIAVIGPNGAGKTTLFNLISGEFLPTQGTVRLFGTDVTKTPAHRRTSLGLARTFQVTDLFPQFTLRENLLLALQAHDRCRYGMFRPLSEHRHLWERAEELLKELKLWEKRDYPVGALSHGETRLVEILVGVAGRPKLLLLDEPMAGLTSSESVWLAGIIRNLLKDVTVLMVEHDMSIAFELAERMIVLHQGELVADGEPAEIRANQRCRNVYLGACYD
ncbi:MAG: ABC transporter ATP-binding protein [Deltaproteobacteria bacterium]|nr:ABC transporter ATP-binding protein [Deltaproteobacteria bacterium]